MSPEATLGIGLVAAQVAREASSFQLEAHATSIVGRAGVGEG
jgi:hypothetical protein